MRGYFDGITATGEGARDGSNWGKFSLVFWFFFSRALMFLVICKTLNN